MQKLKDIILKNAINSYIHCAQVDSLEINFQILRAWQYRTAFKEANIGFLLQEFDVESRFSFQAIAIDILDTFRYINLVIPLFLLLAEDFQHVAIYTVFQCGIGIAEAYESCKILIFFQGVGEVYTKRLISAISTGVYRFEYPFLWNSKGEWNEVFLRNIFSIPFNFKCLLFIDARDTIKNNHKFVVSTL